VRLELAPSPPLAAAILGAHLAAGASVLAVLPEVAGAAVALGLAALGVATARERALLRGARALRALRLTGPAAGELWLADGSRLAVEFGAHPRVGRHWVALAVRRPVRRTILVVAGMLDGRAFRLLRLWALWGRAPGVASGQLPA